MELFSKYEKKLPIIEFFRTLWTFQRLIQKRMLARDMKSQVRSPSKFLVAVLADKTGINPQVFSISMSIQSLSLREFFTAYIALVRFFARMHRLVPLQIHFGCEGLHTIGALVRPFSSMCPHVPSKLGLFHASIPTNIAFVFFQSRVNVPLKIISSKRNWENKDF